MISKKIKCLYLFISFIIVLMACSVSTQQSTESLPEQDNQYDWKQEGFVWGDTISNALMFTVDYDLIEWEQPENIKAYEARLAAYDHVFFMLESYYTSKETIYILQKYEQNEKKERIMLDTDIWGINDGHILGVDVIDSEQLVFWVSGEYIERDKQQWAAGHYYAVYTDHQGNLLKKVDIINLLQSEKIWEDHGIAYVGVDIHCDGKGNIYIGDAQQHKLYLLDGEGEKAADYAYQADEKQDILQSFRTGNGELIFVCGEENALDFIWLDPETGTAKKLATAALKGVKKWYGMYDGILYYATSKQLVGWNVATGDQTLLFKPDANEIENIAETTLVKTDSGLQLMVTDRKERYILSLSTEEPIQEEDIEVVNICGENSFLAGRVATFSRKNPLYKTVYTDAYQEEETVRILMQMINGEGPDILYVSGRDMESLQVNGTLGDLKQLLSAEILDNLLPGAVAMGMYGEQLAGVPMCVNARTMFSNQDYWKEDTWTMQDVLGLLEEHEELEGIFVDFFGQESFYYNLFFLTGMDMIHSPFIHDGSSDFDCSEFQNVLKAIKEKTNEASGLASIGEIAEFLKNGKYLGIEVSINKMTHFCSIYDKIGENANLVGYPTETGNGNYIQAEGMLVVNRNAMEKEGVKKLINDLFSMESQQHLQNAISVRLDIPESQLEYDADEEKYFWVYSDGTKELLPSQPDGTSFLEEYVVFLKNAVPYSGTYDEIFQIISEEADSYFYSDKIIEEVTKTIQQRVQLYLEEQK